MPGGQVETVFAALGDPTRVGLVEALARGRPASSSRLAEGLPISRQAVEKHLAVLARAGLVSRTRAGREALYELTPKPLEQAAGWLEQVGGEWESALERLRRTVERERQRAPRNG